MRIKVWMVIFLLLCFCPRLALTESVQGNDIPLLDARQQQKLDGAQQEASAFLIETAEWIDSFFDNPRALSEENKTRGLLRLEFKYSKEGDFELKPRFSLRLPLF